MEFGHQGMVLIWGSRVADSHSLGIVGHLVHWVAEYGKISSNCYDDVWCSRPCFSEKMPAGVQLCVLDGQCPLAPTDQWKVEVDIALTVKR